MDPEVEGDEAAMAEAMGFSSFGAQDRPQKKRRYNPAADASTGMQRQSHSGQGVRVKEASTGSNSTPLGTSSRNATQEGSANTGEIDLGDDDDEGEALRKSSTRLVEEQETTSSSSAEARPASLPARPAPGTGFVGSTTGRSSDGQGQRTRPSKGSRELWYEGYYDHTSNENPWERLEKSLGLESRGSWVPRNAEAGATVQAT